MKKIALSLITIITLSVYASAQQTYEVVPDAESGHFYKGIITREALARDTTFKWWEENRKAVSINKEAAASFGKYKDSLQLVIFMGTWCSDSHYIIPRLFPFLDAAGFSGDRITLIGVDRNKKTVSHLSEAFNITNVPTIMVLKNGKEIGRVVEYGKNGVVENELVEIVKQL